MKRVGFVLPPPTEQIIGGYKVVYDHANYLAGNGFDVYILHDCRSLAAGRKVLPGLCKRLSGLRRRAGAKWVRLDRAVHVRYAVLPRDILRLRADLVFATAYTTADLVWAANGPVRTGYFIQGFENWDVSDQEVWASYHPEMYKVTVSRWLYEVVRAHAPGERTYCCPNGVDTKAFTVREPIESRPARSVAFLYHQDQRKGLAYLLPALDRLRERYPDLAVRAFGGYDRPAELPDYVQYTAYANAAQLAEIYNRSAIFLCPSLEEGFGLTGAESMACGCALATTRTHGSAEYANESNAVFMAFRDVDDVVAKASYLIENDAVRIRLARQGSEDMRRRSLEEARECFRRTVEQILA